MAKSICESGYAIDGFGSKKDKGDAMVWSLGRSADILRLQ